MGVAVSLSLAALAPKPSLLNSPTSSLGAVGRQMRTFRSKPDSSTLPYSSKISFLDTSLNRRPLRSPQLTWLAGPNECNNSLSASVFSMSRYTSRLDRYALAKAAVTSSMVDPNLTGWVLVREELRPRLVWTQKINAREERKHRKCNGEIDNDRYMICANAVVPGNQ